MNYWIIPGIKEKLTKKALLQKIMAIVSEETGIEIDEIKGRNRYNDIVKARQFFCHLSKTFEVRLKMNISLTMIGKEINKDHTTVIHAINKCNDFLCTEPDYKEEYDLIKKNIKL